MVNTMLRLMLTDGESELKVKKTLWFNPNPWTALVVFSVTSGAVLAQTDVCAPVVSGSSFSKVSGQF